MDPDPTPDPTPFFINCKKIFFFFFFLITCPQAYHLHSKKLKFLLKFCVTVYFRPLNTFMRKGQDTEPDPDLWLMSGSGRPKNMRIRFWIRIPNTAMSIATSLKPTSRFFRSTEIVYMFTVSSCLLPALSPSVGWLGGKSFCLISRSLGRLFKSAGLRNFRSKKPGFFFSTPQLVCSRRWWYLHKVMDDGAAIAAIAAPLWSSGKKEKLNNGLPKVSCTHIVNTVNKRVYLKEVNAHKHGLDHTRIAIVYFFKINIM